LLSGCIKFWAMLDLAWGSIPIKSIKKFVIILIYNCALVARECYYAALGILELVHVNPPLVPWACGVVLTELPHSII
jgi:hypothetical protein